MTIIKCQDKYPRCNLNFVKDIGCLSDWYPTHIRFFLLIIKKPIYLFLGKKFSWRIKN